MHDPILLSDDACDRATAYHMSDKIVDRPEGLFVTWLDAKYRAIVGLVDPENGKVLSAAPIHQGFDNHCGAAMAVTPDGRLHVMAGAHATGGFIHRHSQTPDDPAQWSLPESIGRAATYPSMVALADGTLVLTHRHTSDQGVWGVNVARRAPGEFWNWPIMLTKAPAPGYSYPTATLDVGPDQVIHLVVEFYKTYPQHAHPAHNMAITHLYSEDGGVNWIHDDGRDIRSAPVGIEDVCWIDAHPAGNLRPGNVITLPDNRVALGVTDMDRNLCGLHVRQGPGVWRRWDLLALVQTLKPDAFVNHQPQISLDPDGSIIAVIPVSHEGQWSSPDNQLLALWIDPDTGEQRHHAWIPKPEEGRSNWLASIERPSSTQGKRAPYVIFTDGNRGVGCVNQAQCRVWLASLAR